jgi:hypothetical protein
MTERMNIRRMQMPESSAVTGRIDMDKEMPPVRLKALAELYEAECASGSYRSALKIAETLRILSPDNPALPERPDTDSGFVENLYDRKNAGEWYAFSEEATQMRLAFPAYVPDISREDWKKVEDFWRASPPFSTPLENFIALAYRTKIVFPDSQINLTDSDLTKMNEIIDQLRQLRMQSQYLAYCAERRVLFPEHTFEYTDSDWKFMREALHHPAITIEGFAERAANVKIIAADDVRMTTSGLQITVGPKDVEEQKQKMPEQLAI